MGLQLLEYKVLRAVTASNGTPAGAQLTFGQVPTGQTWRVDRLTVGLTTPLNALTNNPTADIFDQVPPGPGSLPIEHTSLTQQALLFGQTNTTLWFDYDDTGAPITVMAGDELCVVFNDYGIGFTYYVRVQVGVYQGTAGAAQPAAGMTPGPTVPTGI